VAAAASVEGPVLITGAAGFAGSHLAELLAPAVHLVCWSREAAAPGLAPSAQWQQIDLLDRDAVRTAVAAVRPAQIYHLAGVPHVGGSWDATTPTLAGNVLATHYLFDALRRAGVRARVLVTASATVYAPSDEPITEDGAIAPGSPYALSKLAQELLARRAPIEDGLDVVVARAFNHTGPRQTPAFAIPSFARQIAQIERGAQPPVIRTGNLAPRRDLSDVRDVARAYVAVMGHGGSNVVYNVASGVGRSIGDILHSLVARARVRVTVETDPALLRANDTAALVGDYRRLNRDTGWKPEIPFEKTLDDLLEYWRTR
jgi:GDP-4-dehydro-6-deoxy-D-mannose reductase